MNTKKKWLIIGGSIALIAAASAIFYFKRRKNILDEITADEQSPEQGKPQEAKKASASPSNLTLGDLTNPTIENTGINPSAPVQKITKPVGSIPAKQITVTDSKPATTVTATTTSKPTAATAVPSGTATMLRVVEDKSKNKAILRVTPKNLFKVGDSVKVSGNVYKGTFKIWYIYKSHATEDALYIDTPYNGDDSGTVTK